MRKMARPRRLGREDIMPMERYAAERRALRRDMIALKRRRRMAVGPDATFHFENHETIRHQVHEMLHVERGGEAQVRDELDAYNPLVPDGRQLVATVMFEIGDPERRARVLAGLGGVENAMSISVGGDRIAGVADDDIDRTTADGKASSVQFVRFSFGDDQIARWRAGADRVVVAVEHEAYAHMAVMPDAVRRALAEDFDA